MRSVYVLGPLITCGVSCGAPAPAPPAEPTTRPAEPWQLPAGFRGETIPFPLDFAPGVAHRGVEELRFAPGFFDPAAPGYWSYAFVWRIEDAAALDAGALGAELTAYFRGLIDAVDQAKAIGDRDAIAVTASPAPGAGGAGRFALAAHVFDAFKTHQPLDLVGWAERTGCGTGALWRFVLAPAGSSLRPQLDGLAHAAVCDQPVPPPPPR
ncbi:MAG TPA: hypothetical protein VFK02_01205 [Kofleriaceae bacterium]|nr:hypothetical protein [Kofleriaceae bacterium]